MGNYSSNYTGTQIDAAIGAVNTAVGANGIVNTNGLNTILENYIPLNSPTNTGVFLRGDNTWGNTITLASGSSGEFTATRGNISIWMGIGSEDTNHGLFSDVVNKWMVYCDGTNVYLNGTAESVARASFGNKDYCSHDCNAITSNGMWYYSSNGPATSIGATTGDGALYSQAYNDTWVGQIAQDYRNGHLFIRGKNSGTWTAWDPVVTKTNSSSTLPAIIHTPVGVSYIAGVKGAGATVHCQQTYNTDQWCPVIVADTKSGGGWAIGTYSSEQLQFVYGTKANKDSNTNTVSILNLTAGNGTITTSVSSSIKIKTNITDFTEDEASKILQLRPIKFDYKEGFGEKNQYGFIAEEVEPIIPYVIYKPTVDIQQNQEEYWSIEYHKFIPYIIKLLQMQQTQINFLNKKIENLKNINT